MNKSQIRKKIIKIRKQKKIKKFNFNFDLILNILKKKKVLGKIVGGYYPYNYEIDIFQILEKTCCKDLLLFSCQASLLLFYLEKSCFICGLLLSLLISLDYLQD